MAGTVKVLCNLPHGLVAQVGDLSVTFNGTNSSSLINGIGLTENVDADFWAAWLEQSKGLVLVRDKLVTAVKTKASAAAAAKDQQQQQTGLEPLNPEESKDVKTLNDKAP